MRLINMLSKEQIIEKLTNEENKKTLWNKEFDKKVLGRKTKLGGLGPKALTIKLESSKAFEHLDIKCFLNWEHFDEFTVEERKLVEFLLNQL